MQFAILSLRQLSVRALKHLHLHKSGSSGRKKFLKHLLVSHIRTPHTQISAAKPTSGLFAQNFPNPINYFPKLGQWIRSKSRSVGKSLAEATHP
jgi:hypothetical protein